MRIRDCKLIKTVNNDAIIISEETGKINISDDVQIISDIDELNKSDKNGFKKLEHHELY